MSPPPSGDRELATSPLGKLVARTTDRIVTPVEDMHLAIADEAFRWMGPPAQPVLERYRAITMSAYRGVRFAGQLAGLATDALAARQLHDERVDTAAAGIDAVWGDAADGDDVDATVRDRRSRVVALDAQGIQSAFPDAGGRVVVLLHGLGNTERRWLQSPRDDAADRLIDRLDSAGFTSVLVRFRTSRSVAESAVDVSTVLDAAFAHWPVPIQEISVVGYSMGGLVARAAVAVAEANEASWADAVSRTVSIGAPLLGSHVEKGAELAARALSIAPQTRPLGHFIDSRSEGIKDLRGEGAAAETSPNVTHHAITGTVTDHPTNPLGRLVGDLIVRPGSGLGRRPRDIGKIDERVVGGVTHFTVLDAPEVHDHVMAWLDPTL